MPESLTAEQLSVQQDMHTFATSVAALIDEKNLKGEELRIEVNRLSKSHGLYGLTHPKDLGGREATNIELVIVHDTLGGMNLSHVDGIFGPSAGVLVAVTEPLRSRYLRPMLHGEKRAAFVSPNRTMRSEQPLRTSSMNGLWSTVANRMSPVVQRRIS